MNESVMKGAFVALGTFDGLHMGHKAVITAEKTEYEKKLALMFTTHPQEYLKREHPGRLITPRAEKEILYSWGVVPEYIAFDEIATLSPEEFVDDILVRRYNATSLACGFNYRFGKNAQGDVNTLRRLCAEREIKLTVVDEISYKGEAVSSTRIRASVANGRMQDAKEMLGRYFFFDFEVLHGDERGRILGSPTINQFFTPDFQVPQFGVYASFTEVDGRFYPSVTNIGVRPTIGNSEKRSETNIIGFEGDLYGKFPQVFIVEKIRGEMQFNSLDELSEQIATDREKAKKILKEVKGYGF